jgi:hypothetical protein
MPRFALVLALLLCSLIPCGADEPPSYQVPYRLTNTLHVLVRAKINGKGPYNLIIDTGAPLLFVATKVGKELGLTSDDKGWTVLDRFEMEGGVVQEKVKCRVETPFQLEGMNGMGMAGAELHGIIVYTVLAHYRMEFDFTRDKMKWTKLEGFKPPPPVGISTKGGGSAGGLEIIGGMMKFLGFLSGSRSAPTQAPRGFLGISLSEGNDIVSIKAILPKSPADEAGLKAGDRIDEVDGKGVRRISDLHQATARLTAGAEVRLTVRRGEEKMEIAVKAGDGL